MGKKKLLALLALIGCNGGSVFLQFGSFDASEQIYVISISTSSWHIAKQRLRRSLAGAKKKT